MLSVYIVKNSNLSLQIVINAHISYKEFKDCYKAYKSNQKGAPKFMQKYTSKPFDVNRITKVTVTNPSIRFGGNHDRSNGRPVFSPRLKVGGVNVGLFGCNRGPTGFINNYNYVIIQPEVQTCTYSYSKSQVYFATSFTLVFCLIIAVRSFKHKAKKLGNKFGKMVNVNSEIRSEDVMDYFTCYCL